MAASQLDYTTGQTAARAWLNANEGWYSSMISDDIIASVVRVCLDAVDAERAKAAAVKK